MAQEAAFVSWSIPVTSLDLWRICCCCLALLKSNLQGKGFVFQISLYRVLNPLEKAEREVIHRQFCQSNPIQFGC